MSHRAFLDASGRPRVAVTGMGVKTPAGVTVDTFWKTVLAGQGTATAHRAVRPVGAARAVRRRGPRRTTPSTYFGPKEVRRVDRFTQLGFGAAADAIDDAGELGADPSRCAVIAATGIGGLETMETNEPTFFDRGASRVSPFFVPMMMPNATAGHDLDPLRLHRPRAVHLHRVRGGRQRDRRRRPHGPRRQRRRRHRGRDRAPVTPLTVAAFARMGAMSTRNDDPARASRPFDAARDGFVIAEGAALLRARDARARAGPRRHASTARSPATAATPTRTTSPRPSPAGPARRRACSWRSTTPASSPTDDRARQRARHLHPAQRRRRGRGDPQGVRRRRAAGHVHQGRHRAHDRRGRGRRGRHQPAARSATASCRPPPTSTQIGDDIELDIVGGEPRAFDRRPVLSNSFGFGGHNATLILGLVESSAAE